MKYPTFKLLLLLSCSVSKSNEFHNSAGATLHIHYASLFNVPLLDAIVDKEIKEDWILYLHNSRTQNPTQFKDTAKIKTTKCFGR